MATKSISEKKLEAAHHKFKEDFWESYVKTKSETKTSEKRLVNGN